MTRWIDLAWLPFAAAAIVFLIAFTVAVAVVALTIDLFDRRPETELPGYDTTARWLDGRRKYWSRLP